MTIEQLTGGESLIRSLLRHGVDTMFGLPGVQTYSIFDALLRHDDKIKTYFSRHEQGAGYMALGYARSTGKPGVYCVVPGPGVLNSTAALATAWGCNEPVLCITGQVPSEFIGRRRGHLHELPDQLATLKSLVKWAARVDQPGDAPALVDEAFRQMTSGRPGPVVLEMAWDVLRNPGPVSFGPPIHAPQTLPADAGLIDQAAKLIVDAEKPLIMVGSGALHAREPVLALGEMLDAPVGAYRSGRGVVSEEHELGVNCSQALELWPDTDLLIAVGTRLEGPYLRWADRDKMIDRADHPKLIRIDIDPLEHTRLKPHVGVVGDSHESVTKLVEALRGRVSADPTRRTRIAEAKAVVNRTMQEVQPYTDYLKVIREAIPRDGILVEEICQAGFASYFAYPIYEPRKFVSSGFSGTLGFGYPTSLGVKAAHPDKAVVSLNGDGGLMFGLPELAAAVQHGLGVIGIVFNNHGYHNVRRGQKNIYDGRVMGSDLHTPDFAGVAQNFGAAGYRVDSPEGLAPVLEQAIADDVPALIEVAMVKDAESSPWPMLTPFPGPNR